MSFNNNEGVRRSSRLATNQSTATMDQPLIDLDNEYTNDEPTQSSNHSQSSTVFDNTRYASDLLSLSENDYDVDGTLSN